MSRKRPVVVLLGLVAAAGVGAYYLGSRPAAHVSRPVGIMGTQCRLQAVVPRIQTGRADRALRDAERALRAVEARMSTYIALTELSHLNAAEAGRLVKLSPDTLAVLRLAKTLHERTDGAFDVTCLPVFKLWARAGKRGSLPTDEEIAAATAASGWDKFELTADGARKTVADAGIGLGGIAKGYAIDRALEAIRRAGCDGGLVDVGGDIRCFGAPPRGGPWRVGVRDPFTTDGRVMLGVLELTGLAVCTSGNYERYSEIDGKRYSHIVDPRTARPVDFAPSVTVVAPTAAVADGWATALSVLGPDGLKLLRPADRIEAMLIVGGPTDYTIHQTPGFGKLLVAPIPPPPGGPTQPTSHKR